jgi:predicted TPR repeat methyltransferase
MNRPAEFFDQFADTFDTIYDGKRSRFMQAVDKTFRSDMFNRFAKTFELLGDLKGRTVLDVGCGSGPYIVEALRRGADRVTGLDPAQGMLDLAAQRVAAAGVKDRTTFVLDLFPPKQPVTPHDFAIVMGVMDYVAEPAPFLRALKDSVTGGAVLSFPSRHWFRTPVRAVRYKLRNCPLFFYDEAYIRQLLTTAGFTKIDVIKLPGAGMDYVAWARR